MINRMGILRPTRAKQASAMCELTGPVQFRLQHAAMDSSAPAGTRPLRLDSVEMPCIDSQTASMVAALDRPFSGFLRLDALRPRRPSACLSEFATRWNRDHERE